jgi:hypothetical protein
MRKHVQLLGILNIIWGSFGLLGALIVILIFGGAVGLIGAAAPHDPGAHIAIPIVGLVGGVIFLVLIITSIPAIIAGIGLLYLCPWSRVLTIILSALHLFSVPFGTALGIYGFWVLLSRETVALFASPGPPIRI